jgi:choloylglycine hydrolase
LFAVVQYQLDNFSTVAEVLASDASIRITGNSAPLHYLVCDRTGACATIEFLEGKTVAHTGDELPVNVLANNTYARSVAFLQQCKGFGGTQPIGKSPGSLDRFARAANLVKQGAGTDPVASAFDILANVAQGEWTKWSIVYDMTGGKIFYRTHANPDIRSVDFATFDFDCSAPIEVLDVNAEGAGDVSEQFEAYTWDANRTLIGNAYSKTEFLQGTPSSVLDSIAIYPEEATACQKK